MSVRSLPFPTDEFFAAIRSCYNKRSQDPEWKRVTFCLLGVATPSDLIQNPQTTPFNIGRRIELADFTLSDVSTLAPGMSDHGGDASLLHLAGLVLSFPAIGRHFVSPGALLPDRP